MNGKRRRQAVAAAGWGHWILGLLRGERGTGVLSIASKLGKWNMYSRMTRPYCERVYKANGVRSPLIEIFISVSHWHCRREMSLFVLGGTFAFRILSVVNKVAQRE